MEHKQITDLAGTTLTVLVIISIANTVLIIKLAADIHRTAKAVSGFLAAHSTWLDIAGKLIDKVPNMFEGGSRIIVGLQELLRLTAAAGGLRKIMGRDVEDKRRR